VVHITASHPAALCCPGFAGLRPAPPPERAARVGTEATDVLVVNYSL